MEQLWSTISPLWKPLLLLLVANGTPILARWFFASRWNHPLDGGRYFVDRRPLLGATKTWRGLITALLATTMCAEMLGIGWWLGCLFALLSLTGDAVASFCKRRLAIAPHGRATGLDQLPEVVLPLWVLHDSLGLDALEVLLVVLLFVLLDLTLSPLLYRLHIRLRPY